MYTHIYIHSVGAGVTHAWIIGKNIHTHTHIYIHMYTHIYIHSVGAGVTHAWIIGKHTHTHIYICTHTYTHTLLELVLRTRGKNISNTLTQLVTTCLTQATASSGNQHEHSLLASLRSAVAHGQVELETVVSAGGLVLHLASLGGSR